LSLGPGSQSEALQARPTLGTRIRQHFPPRQFLRYVGVGIFNTAFGYTCFAVLNHLFHRANVPASYMYAAVLSNIVSITVAYLGYKFLVFRTRGNYLHEWLKAMGVYGVAAVPSLLLLAPLVHLIAWMLPPQFNLLHRVIAGKDAAPYLANLLLTGFAVFSSFIGHKKVTFRERKS